ncbi:hypothetical protein [Sphingomonas sp. CFBP 8760]|uniref:hypothetical protein n=1 Tax=Sphingomonas sp. CFBP 8760 TaxID=2775282 RepID=UPI00178366BD|nr:hypothetical protein [Sphingomonas sp. CFBP 8760]MBD8548538.1 hypothetical protein [Sphingomonas sp. CFBP 8760]
MSIVLPYQLKNAFFGSLGLEPSTESNEPVITFLCKQILSTLFTGLSGYNKVISFDVGRGKSLFIITLLRFLKDRGLLSTGGIVVFLSRHDEIRNFITGSGLEEDDYAVYTGNNDLNAMGLGNLNINEAPVLFVTQQKLQAYWDKNGDKPSLTFADMSKLHYRGMPRKLRLWDERWLGGKPVTVKLDDVLALPIQYRMKNEGLCSLIDTLGQEAYRDDTVILTVPAGFKDFKLPYNAPDRHRDTVKALAELAGAVVRVVTSNQSGKVLCGSSCPFPADMAPMFIFDAAARVTTGYGHRQAIVGDTQRLGTIQSDYRNVRVHCWEQGASRSSLRGKVVRDRVVDGIAATSNERFLIVHPKARDEDGYDLLDEIRKALDDPSRVDFIHWGNHHGTNEHRETRNVILIGVWHKPTSAVVAEYMAMTGLAGDQMEDGDWNELGGGLLKENVMQAAGRANLRNVRDGVAGECNVYVITAAKDKPIKLVQDVFPNGVVVPWMPVEKPLAGRPEQLINHLVGLKSSGFGEARKQDVSKALGLSTSGLSNLLKSTAELLRQQGFEWKGQKISWGRA